MNSIDFKPKNDSKRVKSRIAVGLIVFGLIIFSSIFFSISVKKIPIFGFNNLNNKTFNSSWQLLQITTTDNNAIDSIWYIWNGINNTYTNPINITFDEGINTVFIWAKDKSGNTIFTSITFFIDTLAPIITILSLSNTTYDNPSQLVQIIALDNNNIDSIWFNWNGVNNTYTNPVSISFNTGVNTLRAWTSDNVGNIASNSVSFFIYPLHQIMRKNQTEYIKN